MNVHEKIQKNILVFQYHFKKKLDNEETIKYKQNFIDSFRFMSTHYRNLLIIYLMGFIKISVNIVNLNLAICLSKIIS